MSLHYSQLVADEKACS